MTRRPFLPSATSANSDALIEPTCTARVSVQLPIGVVKPFEARLFRIGDVNEREAVRAVGDVGISPREIKPLRVFQRHERAGNQLRGFVGSVMSKTLKPSSSVTNSVAELHADRARIFQAGGHFARERRRGQRIIAQADDEQSVLTDDIKVRSRHERIHRARSIFRPD